MRAHGALLGHVGCTAGHGSLRALKPMKSSQRLGIEVAGRV